MTDLSIDRPVIPPALTKAEWAAAYHPETDASLGFEAVHTELVQAADFGRWHQAMALANAALPDSDPRKLTSRHVDLLTRDATADRTDGRLEAAAAKLYLASVIEALLPPADLR